MKENKDTNEVEVLEMDIVEQVGAEIIPQSDVTVSELLKKNNELLAYHNDIMLENKKITNMNSIADLLFKLTIMLAVIVFCAFLYKIYEEVVVSNQKEMKIINNLPQQETPIFNVNVPQADVAVNNQTILDKVSFYRGGYYGFVYKNTSQNIVYCKTKDSEHIHDAVLSPNSIVELSSEIEACRDAEIIEIKNPHKPDAHKVPNQQLFKI